MMLRSRHDHFPRCDEVRRRRRHAAASALDAAWRAGDLAPDGLLAAMRAQEAETPEAAIAALTPWLADIDWLRARLGGRWACLPPTLSRARRCARSAAARSAGCCSPKRARSG